ncbi:MAG TPA: gluconate 2-dehydrogenase subunit 3 family protein [Rhizomicrobium sp.]|jgi:gluconate 2-dehydrogenase gamma chain
MSSEPTNKLDRRTILTLGAALGSGAVASGLSHDGTLGGPSHDYKGTLPWREGETDAPARAATGRPRFLTDVEAAFITAAADRLIPADPTGPSASEAGVPEFIDRQLAGAYGQGDHFYLGGPWAKGTLAQGYQSRFTPAQFYRHAIAEIERHVGQANNGKAFKDLDANTQDTLLKQMESGDLKLNGSVDSKAFFTMFLQNVKEGYFSDPIYGGNKNGSAWKMIGFPGAHYDYSPWVTAYNKPVPVKPVGLLGRLDWKRG